MAQERSKPIGSSSLTFILLSLIFTSRAALPELSDLADQTIHGAVLLTGTGIVPPDNFTLADHDKIMIELSGIGTLTNSITVV